VVDGYVFTGDDGWKPLPPPPPRRRLSTGSKVGIGALVVLLVTMLLGFSNNEPPVYDVACEEVNVIVDGFIEEREENLALARTAPDGASDEYKAQADSATALVLQNVVDNPQCFNPQDVTAARGALPIVQARLAE
jgi:hypothetical protein